MQDQQIIKDNFIKQEINLNSAVEGQNLRNPELQDEMAAQQNQQNFSEKTDQSNRINNLKNSSSNKKSSFFPNFNGEILLQGLAAGCLLGVLLFYFQGLQPLILKSYSEGASKKIVQLNERYNEQVNPILDVQKSFDSSFEDYSDKVCSQQDLYQSKNADLDKIDRLKLSLVPDASYKVLSSSGVFYNSEIQNIYQSFFAKYVNSLQDWEKLTPSIAVVPNFLDFRNVWVKTCQKIEASQGDLAILKEACTGLINAQASYESLKNSQFWDQISTGLKASLDRCYEVTGSTSKSKLLVNYGKWRLDWLTGYERITQAKPIWADTNLELSKTSENLLRQATISIDKINLIVEDRRQIINLWYILEFKTGK